MHLSMDTRFHSCINKLYKAGPKLDVLFQEGFCDEFANKNDVKSLILPTS